MKAENKTNFEIRNLTKGKLPSLPFVSVKEAILSSKYEISLVFCGNTVSHKINYSYRGKNKPTNVLSFPLSKDGGEIFLNIPLIKKEAKLQNVNFKDHLFFLFIHGLLHLKGLDHGPKMEKEEQKFLKKFKI